MDFFSSVVPFTTSFAGSAALTTAGVASAVIAPANTGVQRFILHANVGNQTVTVSTLIRIIITGTPIVLAEFTPWVPTCTVINAPLVLPVANGLTIETLTAGAAQTLAWTVVVADCPRNLLLPYVNGVNFPV